MKVSWPKVVMLFLYIVGALVSLAITHGGSSGEAIAYMFAGAAANQGASIGNGYYSPYGRSKPESNPPYNRSKRDTLQGE